MSELDLKEVQAIVRDILFDVDNALASLGIAYFLDFGTLLGACRGKGFIPWDDDIDLAVSQDGLDLFRQLGPKVLPGHLEIAPHSLFPSVVKVFDSRYRILEKSPLVADGSEVSSPAVDLFPIVSYRRFAPNLPTVFMSRIASVRSFARRRSSVLLRENPLKAVPMFGASAVPVGFIRAYRTLVESSCEGWANLPSESLLGHGLGSGFRPEYLPVETVFPLRTVEFEGTIFPAPRDSDAYLTAIYGSWRTPPPPEKQFPDHFLKGWRA